MNAHVILSHVGILWVAVAELEPLARVGFEDERIPLDLRNATCDGVRDLDERRRAARRRGEPDTQGHGGRAGKHGANVTAGA